MRSRIPRLLAVLCLCLACARVHAQQDDAHARYADLLRQGVDAFTQGEWQSARAAFERAHAIEPTARTFRGLALCDFELGHYAQAIRELESALSDPRRPLTPELRAQVLRTLERALRDVGRVHLVLPEGASELRVDGRVEPLPEGGTLLLDPGPHSLQLVFEEREPLTRQLEIENGVTQNLIFASAPPRRQDSRPLPAASRSEAPAPLPTAPQPIAAEAGAPRLWSWLALGATCALGAGTAGLAVATADKHAQFSKQRDTYAERISAGEPGVPPSDRLRRSGQRLELLTNLGIAGTAVLGAATVALFVLERPGRESAQTQLGVTPGGLVLSGRF